MPFPDSSGLRSLLEEKGLGSLWRFIFQDLSDWVRMLMDTYGDFTIRTKGKGVVLTNAAGTVTKRVRLNDAGNGLIFEDP